MNPNAPEVSPTKALQINPVTGNSEASTYSDPMIDASDEFPAEAKTEESVVCINEDSRIKKSKSDAEKAEFAPQILLNFIVKSVQHNYNPASQSLIAQTKSAFTKNSSKASTKKVCSRLWRWKGIVLDPLFN
ncbi:hypothetical protein AgCh_031669 [Apium graveolens]